MVRTILIGIGAGVAAALLFLAPAGGSALAFPLFILTGLPIAIAGLAWGYGAAAVAALAGSAVILGLLPSPLSALVFLLLFGLPMVWLTRLAGLSRETGGAEREWYPAGRILFHASLAAAIVVVLTGIVIGYDTRSVAESATAALVEWLADAGTQQPPTAEEIGPAVEAYVAVMPLMVAILHVAITIFDLWLAMLVARASGRLQRTRERLSAIVAPNLILTGAFAAALLTFLPAPFGEIAQVFAGAFICALAIVGLAVLHAVTIGVNGRVPILVIAYGLLLLSGLPILLFAIVGAGEPFLHLRARRAGPASKND